MITRQRRVVIGRSTLGVRARITAVLWKNPPHPRTYAMHPPPVYICTYNIVSGDYSTKKCRWTSMTYPTKRCTALSSLEAGIYRSKNKKIKNNMSHAHKGVITLIPGKPIYIIAVAVVRRTTRPGPGMVQGSTRRRILCFDHRTPIQARFVHLYNLNLAGDRQEADDGA